MADTYDGLLTEYVEVNQHLRSNIAQFVNWSARGSSGSGVTPARCPAPEPGPGAARRGHAPRPA